MAAPGVVWVKVEKPVFDLWGVLVSSFTLTGLLALSAFVAGGLLALAYILRGRGFGADPPPCLDIAHPRPATTPEQDASAA